MSLVTPDRAPTSPTVEPPQDQQPQHRGATKRPWWWFVVAAVAAVVVGLATYFGVQALFGTSNVEPSGSAAVTNSHSAVPGEPALIPVPGFQYVDAPVDTTNQISDMVTTANSQVAQMAPQLKGGFYTAYSVHGLTTQPSEDAKAGLVLLAVNPKVWDLPMAGSPDQVLIGMAGGMAGGGADVTTTTIGGEKVVVAGQTGTTTMAWYQDDVITMVTGDEAVARDYANAYFDTVSNS